MSNSVPINSIYSKFYVYFQYIQQKQKEKKQTANYDENTNYDENEEKIIINPKYEKLNDVSISYLFESVGPTRYEINLISPALQSCYQYTIYDLLTNLNEKKAKNENNDDIMTNIFAHSTSNQLDSQQTTIKASSAYFRPQPNQVTVDEIDDDDDDDDDNKCHIKRVIGSGTIITAQSPSTSCTFPGNLAKLIEDKQENNQYEQEEEEEKEEYIVLTDRGECTFYDKINTLWSNNNNDIIKGVIVGNIIESSNGNIFTMGSDGTETEIDLATFMINKLSYNALTRCSLYNFKNNMKVELIEVLTRCEEEISSDLNVHGINSHFYVSSLSNSGFVVTQDKDKEIFRLSLP